MAPEQDNIGFVLTYDDYKKVIKESKRSLKVIDQKLGLGGWFDNTPLENIRVVFIKEPFKHNLRLPTGNEEEAFPEWWLPGGKTSGGLYEAVIDFVDSNGEAIDVDDFHDILSR